ncbi:unnamed protein product [Linum trigynum]|uniref:Uncharacterized protein n=1 Tax=Linum trigynum TaxID=586398 RepID=A0AAV2E3K7_9ROSI
MAESMAGRRRFMEMMEFDGRKSCELRWSCWMAKGEARRGNRSGGGRRWKPTATKLLVFLLAFPLQTLSGQKLLGMSVDRECRMEFS